MNKLTCLLAVCALILGGQNAMGQSTLQPVRIDAYPPSPTAASLGKYADIPVGLYNGTANIDIPLWEIEEGAIKLPISLGYHGGGIQLAEQSSWVGLGWALQAGGVITRTARGLPDDGDLGFLNTNNRIPMNFNSTPSNEDFNTIWSYSQGYYDSQPDLFMFNFGGRTGKFQMDQDGNRYITPLQRIKIDPTTTQGSRSIIKWTITTEDGFKYVFDQMEKSRSLSACDPNSMTPAPTPAYTSSWYLSSITSPSGDVVTLQYDPVSPYSYRTGDYQTSYDGVSGVNQMPPLMTCSTFTDIISSVRLKSITFTNGSIVFNASTSDRKDLPGDKSLDNIQIKDNAGNVIKKYNMTYKYMYGSDLYTTATVPFGASVTSLRLALMEVLETSGNGTVSKMPHVFDYELGLPDRTSYAVDHWGFYNGKIGNTKLVPASYFNSTYYTGADRTPTTDATKGSLRNVTYPTGGRTGFFYELNTVQQGFTSTKEYNAVLNLSGNSSATIPAYANNSSLLIKVPFTIGVDPYQALQLVTMKRSQLPCNQPGCGCAVYATVEKNVGGNPNGNTLMDSRYNCQNSGTTNTVDRSDITTFLSPGNYFIVIRLANPYSTLITTPFDVKVNWYERYDSNTPVPAGGIRIKRMEDFNGTEVVEQKDYNYNDASGKSTGSTLKWPSYGYTYMQESDQANLVSVYYVRTSTPNSPLSTTQGSQVGYGQVTEYYNDKRDGIWQQGYLGKSISKFTTPETFAYRGASNAYRGQGFPFAPSDYIDWMGGTLLEKTDLQLKEGLNKEVRKVVNEYLFHDEYNNFNSNIRNCIGLKIGHSYKSNQTNLNRFTGEYYNFYTGYSELVKTTETLYDDNDVSKFSTKTTTYLNSLDHLQPIKSSATTSDGKLLTTFTSFPSDYTDVTGFIGQLKLANILKVPIEKVTYKSDLDGTSNVRIVSGELNTYQDNAKGLLDEVFTLETGAPVQLADFRFSNRGSTNVLPPSGTAAAFYRHPSKYTSRIKYAYDAKSNVVQYTKDGFATSLLWGYTSTLPIAKALNASSTGNITVASQIAYNGYETGTITGEPGWEAITVGTVVSKAMEPANVFAGRYAYKMAAPASGTSYSSILNLYPSPQKGRYKMGCWVKTAPGFVEGLATIEMYAIKKGTAYAKYPVNALNAARFVIPFTNDKWQYFETVLDFDAVKALVPTEELSIRCYTANRNTTPVYIDEVRICPMDAQMSTLTHDPLVGPSSIVDPDNSAELYEYDALGRVKLVKNHEGNILKSYTYKYKGQ